MNETVINSGDEVLDPRVKGELEILNFASAEINKLEREIDMARNKFRALLSDSSNRLNILLKKLGKCVGKARPYYELVIEFRQAEDELNKATVDYQRANSLYRAAKETVALAEERMTTRSDNEKPQFDSAWQEMMNHATMRFNDTEKEKRQCEVQHQVQAATFAAVSQKIRAIEKDIPRSINRAKPYFSLKDQLEIRLQAERQSVEDLQRALTAAKETYRESLRALEAISEEIHEKRKLSSLPERTPGVGAEASAEMQADMLSINLDAQSLSSDAFPDDCDVASLSSQDFILDSPSPTDPVIIGAGIPGTAAITSPTDSITGAGILGAATTAATITSPTKATITKPVITTEDPLSAYLKKKNNVDTENDSSLRPSFVNDMPPPPPAPFAPQSDRTLSNTSGAIPKHRQHSTTAALKVKNDPEVYEVVEQITDGVEPEDTDVEHGSTDVVDCREHVITPSVRSFSASRVNSSHNTENLSNPHFENNSSNQDRDNCSINNSNAPVAAAATTNAAQQPQQQRGRPRDKRIQKLNPSNFPILQGLTECNKRLSPKLPHGRPKGQDITLPGYHSSPSPVRKTGAGYFVYPEPKLRHKNGVAREMSPGPNLFPDTDTSLFEKKDLVKMSRPQSAKGIHTPQCDDISKVDSNSGSINRVQSQNKGQESQKSGNIVANAGEGLDKVEVGSKKMMNDIQCQNDNTSNSGVGKESTDVVESQCSDIGEVNGIKEERPQVYGQEKDEEVNVNYNNNTDNVDSDNKDTVSVSVKEISPGDDVTEDGKVVYYV